MFCIADQPHGFAGSAESRFNLRTDRHPLNMAPQNIGQESIPLVSAVEADFFPQQTTADADTDRQCRGYSST